MYSNLTLLEYIFLVRWVSLSQSSSINTWSNNWKQLWTGFKLKMKNNTVNTNLFICIQIHAIILLNDNASDENYMTKNNYE